MTLIITLVIPGRLIRAPGCEVHPVIEQVLCLMPLSLWEQIVGSPSFYFTGVCELVFLLEVLALVLRSRPWQWSLLSPVGRAPEAS